MQRIVRHTLAIVLQIEGDLAETAGPVDVHLLEGNAVWSALARQALAAWQGEQHQPLPPYEGRIWIAPHAHGYQVQIVLWWIARQPCLPRGHPVSALPRDAPALLPDLTEL